MAMSTIIIGLLLLGLVIYVISIYNSLVTMKNRYLNAFSQIEVQLKRRYDLIPNLVETVKAYAAHEKDTLTEVTNARAKVGQMTLSADKLGDAAAMQQFQQAQGGLSSALSRLMVVVERYPDLKASANFQSLQNELGDVEDKLAAARRALNAAAARFNAARESFPAVLFAGMLGFGEADFSRLAESEKGVVDQTPKVAF